MIYYSTGKSPYMRKRGVPCEPHPNTAESLIKKGYLVRTLEELYDDGVKAPLEEKALIHPDVLPPVVVSVTPREKPAKKVKPKKNSKKVTKK